MGIPLHLVMIDDRCSMNDRETGKREEMVTVDAGRSQKSLSPKRGGVHC